MATLHQALKFIKAKHYHRLIPHQKHFVNQMLDGLDGLGEVSDSLIGDYISEKQEKFIWVLAKRFGIYVSKIIHPLKPTFKKPDLPLKVPPPLTYVPELEHVAEFKIKWTNPHFFIQTNLGAQFDHLATIDRYATIRPSPPYDLRFQNRPIITIYGLKSKTGIPVGRAFLEMVSSNARDFQERHKISAFLAAMDQIDPREHEIPRKPKKTVKVPRIRKKGLAVAA